MRGTGGAVGVPVAVRPRLAHDDDDGVALRHDRRRFGHLVAQLGLDVVGVRPVAARARRFICLAASSTVLLWDYASAKHRYLRVDGGAVNGLAISDSETLLAVVDAGGNLTIWSLTNFDIAASVPCRLAATVAFVDNDRAVVTAHRDGRVTLWALSDGTARRQWSTTITSPKAILPTNNPNVIVVVGADRFATVDVTSLGSSAVIVPVTSPLIIAVCTHPGNADSLLGVTIDADFAVVDVATGHVTRRQAASLPKRATTIATNGTYVFVGDEGGSVRLYTPSTFELIRHITYQFQVRRQSAGAPVAPGVVSITACSHRHIVVAYDNNDVHVLDLLASRIVAYRCGAPIGDSVAFCTGPPIVMATTTRRIQTWSGNPGDPPVCVTVTPSPVTSIAVTSCGKRVAIGCSDGDLRVMTMTPTKTDAHIDLGPTAIRALTFASDGSIGVYQGDHRVTVLWSAAHYHDGVVLQRRADDNVNTAAVAFVDFVSSGDGPAVVVLHGCANGHVIKVTRADTATDAVDEAVAIDVGAPITAARLHPSSLYVVAATLAGEVGVWRVASGEWCGLYAVGAPVAHLSFDALGIYACLGFVSGHVDVVEAGTGQACGRVDAGGDEDGLVGAYLSKSTLVVARPRTVDVWRVPGAVRSNMEYVKTLLGSATSLREFWSRFPLNLASGDRRPGQKYIGASSTIQSPLSTAPPSPREEQPHSSFFDKSVAPVIRNDAVPGRAKSRNVSADLRALYASGADLDANVEWGTASDEKTETVQDIGAFEERLSKSGNDDLDRVVKATVDNILDEVVRELGPSETKLSE
ncbi:Uncharacterized protein PBTT_05246 [Plasmodiophora brassicae]|uniref:Uncharacterized protein n=1 Tax=Plasmodiophora brassicae TaxID=37360 RepID=A0A0G4IR65_PLABS|nr:hypothetical protein PBRA_000974 [Plasmodiophora brassicae]SPQ97925.1 unnamed protein product [Plasmodiophora brassicae]